MVGATAAALVAMVARVSSAAGLAERADALRAALLAAEQRDEAAYAAVVAAQALPKEAEADKTFRAETLQAALAAAAQEPLQAAGHCLAVLQLARESLTVSSRGLVSDAGCAAEFAAAAIAACAYNVRINHRYMNDSALIARGEDALVRCEREAAPLLEAVRRHVVESVRRG